MEVRKRIGGKSVEDISEHACYIQNWSCLMKFCIKIKKEIYIYVFVSVCMCS